MDDTDAPITRCGTLPGEVSSSAAPPDRLSGDPQDAPSSKPQSGIRLRIRNPFRNRVYQSLAIMFCVLFGIAMIANTQMQGEAFWFWYATLFHQGAKLYSDLHLVLQPLFVLQTDAWMTLFGTKTWVMEVPSIFEVLAFCVAMLLVLRESDWPDWQKAIVLASGFLISIQCTAYRFDDNHIVADIYVFYSLVLLLIVARTDKELRQFQLVAALGVVCGFAMTTRLNDGSALLAAICFCLFFLVRTRKALSVGVFVAVAALTAIVVVRLTGDSFSSYISNSVIKAAGSKGGGGSIVTAPYHLFCNALKNGLHILRSRKRILVSAFVILVASAIAWQRWKVKTKYIFLAQVGFVVAACYLWPGLRAQIWSGEIVSTPSLLLIALNYVLAVAVAARFFWSRMGVSRYKWDSREILVLLPLAELASASASTAAQTTDGFLFSQVAMLLLLVPILQPFCKQAGWLYPSFLTALVLMGTSGLLSKVWNPYSWMNYRSSPMFVNRQWYQHPAWGPMYVDRDLLHFGAQVCGKIGAAGTSQELLSLPYSYPNYFCDIPPWHGYVQTFFDTSSRSSINQLMQELDSAPPQWIVYQRQMKMLWGQESVFGHGKPLPQRALDTLIMQKLASGKWQLVDKVNYLEGDGWLVIRTRS